jgi:hypothetical protein
MELQRREVSMFILGSIRPTVVLTAWLMVIIAFVVRFLQYVCELMTKKSSRKSNFGLSKNTAVALAVALISALNLVQTFWMAYLLSW